MEKKQLYMLLGDLAILFVAFIWGATNVVVRDALSGITPFWFCAFRFVIACAVLAPFIGKSALALPSATRFKALFLGTVFISAYLVGAWALLYTTAGNQSFIISTSVVFVPLVLWIITRNFPGWHVLASAFLCMTGMCGLMIGPSLSVNVGDLLCFVSMSFITAHIILVQKFVRDTDPYGLTFWQSAGGAVLALAVALVFEPFPHNIPTKAWIAVSYSATVAFALTLALQTVAQKYTTAPHAAILLSTSGIFGSLLGIIFLGEPMTWSIFAASALILAGVITVEAVPILRREK